MNGYKIAGFLIISLSSLAIGWSSRHKVNRRAKTLRSFSELLSRFHGEISYSQAHPEEVFELFASEEGYIGVFFKTLIEEVRKNGNSLPSAWKSAIKIHIDNLCLNEAEVSQLERLSVAISRLDLDGALNATALACDNFKAWAEIAEKNAKNEGKMKFTFWAAGGLLLALLLI